LPSTSAAGNRSTLLDGFKAPTDVTALGGVVPAELLEEARGQDAWVASRSGLVEAEPSPPARGPSPDEERQNMVTLGAF
jgi:hypothetical protein